MPQQEPEGETTHSASAKARINRREPYALRSGIRCSKRADRSRSGRPENRLGSRDGAGRARRSSPRRDRVARRYTSRRAPPSCDPLARRSGVAPKEDADRRWSMHADRQVVLDVARATRSGDEVDARRESCPGAAKPLKSQTEPIDELTFANQRQMHGGEQTHRSRSAGTCRDGESSRIRNRKVDGGDPQLGRKSHLPEVFLFVHIGGRPPTHAARLPEKTLDGKAAEFADRPTDQPRRLPESEFGSQGGVHFGERRSHLDLAAYRLERLLETRRAVDSAGARTQWILAILRRWPLHGSRRSRRQPGPSELGRNVIEKPFALHADLSGPAAFAARPAVVILTLRLVARLPVSVREAFAPANRPTSDALCSAPSDRLPLDRGGGKPQRWRAPPRWPATRGRAPPGAANEHSAR